MPLRFLLGITACFATIAVGLVYPTWYAPVIVQCVCFLIFMYAIKLATVKPAQSSFPFIGFVFAGMYFLFTPDAWGWTPTGQVIHQIRDFFHPPPPSNGKPNLYDDWHGWFDVVARMGISLCVATAMYYATALISGRRRVSADELAEQSVATEAAKQRF